MSVDRRYCGEIPDDPQIVQMIFAIMQFVAIAINSSAKDAIYVHPVVITEHGRPCLYIDIVKEG